MQLIESPGVLRSFMGPWAGARRSPSVTSMYIISLEKTNIANHDSHLYGMLLFMALSGGSMLVY